MAAVVLIRIGREIFVPVVQGSDLKTSGPDGIPGNEDDK